ncbi:2-amino-4-hydroxy-6-hydroxymethyldihydropteridine diphosphokinase [Rhodobacterales bacterium HKCCE3408]|nr:2-amino-4-hydroxy-6-hydroxymethyldihydropteridine diphosphokinase [Rhodobacterales bacterium HKCCE3408]
MALALVALGANLPSAAGTPEHTVAAAMADLAQVAGGAVRSSALYSTPAFPAGAGPDYVNAAAAFDWTGEAEHLLEELHAIEARYGRTRGRRWEARLLDLDLIALGDLVLPDELTESAWRLLPVERAQHETPDTLILPHPRLAERAFVLVPLAGIAPDWRHPVTGLTVRAMRDDLPPSDVAAVRTL